MVPGSTMSEKHQQQLWDVYKTLDEKAGILHNDSNCLNVMIDEKGDIKLIDFDRSKIIETKEIKKFGPYINIRFLHLLNCFKRKHRKPGENLLRLYAEAFGRPPPVDLDRIPMYSGNILRRPL